MPPSRNPSHKNEAASICSLLGGIRRGLGTLHSESGYPGRLGRLTIRKCNYIVIKTTISDFDEFFIRGWLDRTLHGFKRGR